MLHRRLLDRAAVDIREDRSMDSARSHPGTAAEVSGLLSRIYRFRYWHWSLRHHCHLPSDIFDRPLPGIAPLSCHSTQTFT